MHDAYNYIIGDDAKLTTATLRQITDAQQARDFKAANFDYCTFSGVFNKRSDKELKQHSDLLCLDFDHLKNLEEVRQQLLNDDYFDTQLLFVSPSGDGLKWIIEIDLSQTAPICRNRGRNRQHNRGRTQAFHSPAVSHLRHP